MDTDQKAMQHNYYKTKYVHSIQLNVDYKVSPSFYYMGESTEHKQLIPK